MRQRIFVAVFLAPLIIGSVLYLPDDYFIAMLGGWVAIGAWEWIRLYHFKRLIAGAYVVLCSMSALMLSSFPFAQLWLSLAAIAWACSWWVLFNTNFTPNPIRALISGILILPAGAMALFWLRDQYGAAACLSVLFIVWAVDIAGMLVGRKWGRETIFPTISPNKTWEGFYAQMGIAVLASVIFVVFFGFAWAEAVGLSILTTIACIGGDLFVSMLKRENNVKDTGTIIVGHGGVLDRVDGLLAAAPVYWFLLGWI